MGRLRTLVVGTVAVVAAVLAIGGLLALLDEDPSDHTTKIAAPNVLVGDADAVVLATTFDRDAARAQIDPGVVDAVRGVEGVAGAQGALRRFVEVAPDAGQGEASDEAQERSTVAMSADGAAVSLSDGRLPETEDEIAVNSVLADRFQLTLDGRAIVHTGPPLGGVQCTSSKIVILPPNATANSPEDYVAGRESECHRVETGETAKRVVGIFTLPDGDVPDANVAIMTTDALRSLTSGSGYDRIDVKVRHDVTLEDVLDRIGAVLPDGLMVIPPTVLGAGDQLRSELEIQRAYHYLVGTDVEKRKLASEPKPPVPGVDPAASYEENRWQAVNTDMRVSRVAFVDADTALVTYAIYYSGRPSPLAPEPRVGLVVRRDGRWMLSSQNVCELASIIQQPCIANPGEEVSNFLAPPDGWSPTSLAPDAVAALRVLADPASTVEERVAVVQDGAELRDEIAAGAAHDAQRAGGVAFNVLGVRLLTSDRVQVLYSLVANGDPRLETPYPVPATMVNVDGSWRAVRRYACGLEALAGVPCSVPLVPTTTSTTVPPAASTTSSTTTSTTSPSTTSTTSTTTSTTSPPATTTTTTP
jgi:hypothetical protein